MQTTRGVAKPFGDENVDTYFCEQQCRIRQKRQRVEKPVNVPILYLGLPAPVYRRSGKLCRCTGCKRQTLDEVVEDESKAAEEAEREGEDPQPKQVWSLKDFSNVILPTSFSQDVATGRMCAHPSTLQRC